MRRVARIGLLCIFTLLVCVLLASGSVVAEPYNVSDVEHNGNILEVTSQSTTGTAGVSWNTDGTKMYVSAELTDNIDEYDVSEPFNASTATYSGTSLDTTGELGFPIGHAWKPGGEQLYVMGDDGGTSKLVQYSLTTPYDLSSASHNRSITLGTNPDESNPSYEDLAWNNDGSKAFLLADRVHEFDLSESWNISTLSWQQSADVSSEGTGMVGIDRNNDGSKLFLVDQSTTTVYEYELTTPDDVSTLSLLRSRDVSSESADNTPTGVEWANEGNNLYVTDVNFLNSDAFVIQYSTPDQLEGYVINNKTNDPVEGVEVSAFEQTGSGLTEVASTTTDATGNWSLDVTDGQYELVYNNSSYYQSLDNVTVSGQTDVGEQLLEPIPTAYINADPRNAEYERNRTAGAFNVSIEMREPPGQGNQVTSRFMWYNRSADEYQEFNSITWDPSGGGVFVPQDFVVPNDWNNGTNRWFVNTTTDRGNFHSANYTFITPGNITLVNAEDTSQVVDYSTVAIFIESLESDFDTSQTITTGKFDLNDVPEEDLRLRFESRGGQDLLDRTLIIDESQIANLWSVAMINVTDFNAADSTWYNQSFELDDQTGQWDSEDTYLLLSQRVGGSYKLVAGDTFGASNNVDLVVNESEQYRLTLVHAVRGEIREKGFFEADTNLSDTTIVIPVRGTDSDFSEIDSGFQINASIVGAYDESIDPPFLVIKYQDPDDKTFDLSFSVFERGNESNILRGLENVSYDNLGTLVLEQALTSEEAKGEYVVEWEATRNGNEIGGRIIVGARGELGIPLATQDKTILAVIIILIIAGLASQVNAVAVAMAVSGTSGIAWYIQWLPAEVGVTMLAVGMAVPAFYLARNNQFGGG